MDSQTPPSATHPFRNATEGTHAKREKLLIDRRADLALMSHTIRRIYVARSARIGACVAFLVGGGLLLAASYSPRLALWTADLLPGGAPAPLSNLLFGTWLGALLAALFARSIAERRFTKAMSKAVLPSEDLDQDVARLAGESPNSVGIRMTQRLERMAGALPIVAAGLMLPTTAMAAILVLQAQGYPRIDHLEGALGTDPSLLLGFASLSGFFALVLAVRPRWAMGVLPPIALVHAVLVPGIFAWVFLLIGATALAVLAPLLHFQLRRENASLGSEGAIPPLQLRKKLLATKTKLQSWRPRRVHRLGIVLILITGGSVLLQRASSVADSKQKRPSFATVATQQQTESGTVTMESTADGMFITFDFQSTSNLNADYVLRGAELPPGWQARITITNVSSSGGFFLEVLEDLVPRHLGQHEEAITMHHSNCKMIPVPLLLEVSPYQAKRHDTEVELTIRYNVTLELASDCETP